MRLSASWSEKSPRSRIVSPLSTWMLAGVSKGVRPTRLEVEAAESRPDDLTTTSSIARSASATVASAHTSAQRATAVIFVVTDILPLCRLVRVPGVAVTRGNRRLYGSTDEEPVINGWVPERGTYEPMSRRRGARGRGRRSLTVNELKTAG